jgi:pimeloyl-ACP methyl ester carboxylesterase
MTQAPLHIEDAGTGDPVVLLHSSGLSGRQWRRLSSELLRRGFRAIVPDLTGHGASDAWPEAKPFSFQLDVAHVVALLQRLEHPVHLVGHSYGGFVALLAAKATPERVRSLVLYDPTAFGTLGPTADADATAELARIDFRWDATDAGRERWLRLFVDYWGGDGAWGALREEARAEFAPSRRTLRLRRRYGGAAHALGSPRTRRSIASRIEMRYNDHRWMMPKHGGWHGRAGKRGSSGTIPKAKQPRTRASGRGCRRPSASSPRGL